MSNQIKKLLILILLIPSIISTATVTAFDNALEPVVINRNHNIPYTPAVLPKNVEKVSDIFMSQKFNNRRVVKQKKSGDYSEKSLLENKSWPCGENVTANIDTATRILKITGTGAMTDYSVLEKSLPPWQDENYRNYISEILVEDGVTSIGACAFYNCESLISVTISGTVKSIGDSSFWNCKALNTVTMKEGVTSIGSGAFTVTGLTELTIPNSVTTIGSAAFRGCENLRCIKIGSAVTTIADYAFANCPNLYSISFWGVNSPTGYDLKYLPFSNINENVKDVYVLKTYSGEKFCEINVNKRDKISEVEKCRRSVDQKLEDFNSKVDKLNEKIKKGTHALSIVGTVTGIFGTILGVINMIKDYC